MVFSSSFHSLCLFVENSDDFFKKKRGDALTCHENKFKNKHLNRSYSLTVGKPELLLVKSKYDINIGTNFNLAKRMKESNKKKTTPT